jgi:hypothetical protein
MPNVRPELEIRYCLKNCAECDTVWPNVNDMVLHENVTNLLDAPMNRELTIAHSPTMLLESSAGCNA